ncbi:3'-5' exonuclease [Candidatus Parcubacteria bacterium]|nr:3'-5' exonuclease [Candidatus Parcubacteria bacterium]
MPIIFLDTETTGNDVTKDRLCQVCFRIDGKTYLGYFKPCLPMSVKSMSVTHITNKMLEDKPDFEGSDMQNKLREFLKDGVMVAHNAKFDKAILEADGVLVPRFICTLRLSRFLDDKDSIPEYNLQYLRYHLDLDVPGNAHDAEGDVNVLERLYERLFQRVRKECESDEEAVGKMIEISSKPCIFRKFNFGKYKDKMLDEVATLDRKYLEWLLNEKEKMPTEEEDWIYTLKHYLSLEQVPFA